jgi:hypothetical protein
VTFYPQIGTGVVIQFPFRRTRKWRSISNELESGEQIIVPDAAGGQIEWNLTYRDLSDSETRSLSDLFAASAGSFGSFVFVDPLANLLGWSEDLSRPDWQLGLLGQSGGIKDPLGTQRASSITNGSAGTQQLSQTLGISGDYVACLSTWVRSAEAGAITLQRDGSQKTAPIGPQWTRIYLGGRGTPGAEHSTFSVQVAAGHSIDIWGLQVEVQPYPSVYRRSTTACGIYEETCFGDDEITIANTGPGLASCRVKLISRV